MISQALTSEYMSHDLYQVRDKSSAAQFITALFFIISGFIIAASSFAVTDYGIMFRLFMMTMGSVIAVYGLVLCFKGSDENVVYHKGCFNPFTGIFIIDTLHYRQHLLTVRT